MCVRPLGCTLSLAAPGLWAVLDPRPASAALPGWWRARCLVWSGGGTGLGAAGSQDGLCLGRSWGLALLQGAGGPLSASGIPISQLVSEDNKTEASPPRATPPWPQMGCGYEASAKTLVPCTAWSLGEAVLSGPRPGWAGSGWSWGDVQDGRGTGARPALLPGRSAQCRQACEGRAPRPEAPLLVREQGCPSLHLCAQGPPPPQGREADANLGADLIWPRPKARLGVNGTLGGSLLPWPCPHTTPTSRHPCLQSSVNPWPPRAQVTRPPGPAAHPWTDCRPRCQTPDTPSLPPPPPWFLHSRACGDTPTSAFPRPRGPEPRDTRERQRQP